MLKINPDVLAPIAFLVILAVLLALAALVLL
jgi:hypothetical protein